MLDQKCSRKRVVYQVESDVRMPITQSMLDQKCSHYCRLLLLLLLLRLLLLKLRL